MDKTTLKARKDLTGTVKAKYEKFCRLSNKITDISNAVAILSWDQETQIPKKGNKYRAQQIATLTGISHNMFISDEFHHFKQR